MDCLQKVLRVSHLALVRASVDGKSLAKLKMTLAALQCRLSSESKSSCRLVPPHTAIPYVTAGIITLKYKFKSSCLGRNLLFVTRLSQSRTQSPRASWSAGERPERLWDNRLHFPRKRGFRSYYVCLSLTGNRKEKTVNSRNGGLKKKVSEKQEF